MSCLTVGNQLYLLSTFLRREELKFIKTPDITTIYLYEDDKKAASWDGLCIFCVADDKLCWVKKGGDGPHVFDPTTLTLPETLLKELKSVKIKWDNK